MANQGYKPIAKPLAIETRLVLSMLYQIKSRLEIKRWMKPQDIYEAHRRYFEQIEDRCKRDYGHPAGATNHLKAIEILMEGFNPTDILP